MQQPARPALLSDSLSPLALCSKPTIDPTVLGPHTTKMLITPPPNNIGQPFEYYEVKVRHGSSVRGGTGCCLMRRAAPFPASAAASPDCPPAPHACPQVCIKDTQTCFTRQTSGPVRRRLLAAPDTPFDYIVTDPECSDTATDCLRSDTDYTCTTTAVKAGGVIKSLESDPKNFRTDSHE